MSIREKFIVTKRYSTISLTLMVIGVLAIIGLYVTQGAKDDPNMQARFWGSLLQNSVYFLLVVNAAMFFICATTLAWGGWQMAFRRVPEAISAVVPVIGTICGVILLLICFGNNHEIYHWTNVEHVKSDPVLNFKKGFLNKNFFAFWTVLTIVAWSALGWKMRKLSRSLDDKPLATNEEKKKYVWNNTVWAALFIVVFALTVMSSIPWLWLMSIDAHWYSTMYSWYTFASTFVAGMALICLFVVYLKNSGYLEYTNEEHLHDIGKFMFAFSVFWTYLWFSQFMLIWYANIPEETTYFKPRAQGVYSGIFWIMFIINFLAPLLILMRRGAKRNYSTVTFMALLIIFGHWLDFYQMVFPSPLTDPKTGETQVPMILYDFGVALGFAGLIMFVTGRALSKAPLLAKNHPFVKESLIHHT
ncbi:MAG: quinol:cytochrome C oxidoreductase [Chitinophagaceae bacterium]|nr:quinol:cytochrome C oxidoreductase [Chitinophagaceae bacterium]MBK9569959.1 quinol:cytochrome C oxidoreductase [Chitinophagaceae bacterium]MBL0272824.1 quinol:cytochrome C oxidoreductase [Chitinophagaceae bacterium]